MNPKENIIAAAACGESKIEETIVAASRNKHKIEEIAAITAKFGMHLVSRDEAGVPKFEIEEDGETFEENSFKKANEIMKVCGKTTLADDSGLMTEYLSGAPGVYSARFAGENADDEANNRKLLKLLENAEGDERKAKFVSVITMVFTDGSSIVARGECPGRILREAAGENGFGYDPLFVPEGYERSFAQLSAEEKNEISHRAVALKELERLLAARSATPTPATQSPERDTNAGHPER